MSMTCDIELQTARLIARPPTLSDAAALFALMKSAKLTEFLAWAPHQNIEETQAVVASLLDSQRQAKAYHWVIIREREIVGLVSLINVVRQHRTWQLQRAELSYWLGDRFQNLGYATEISRAVIQFAFQHLMLNKLIVAHEQTNFASQKVIEKLGFKHYALERQAFHKNGNWHNLRWYDLLASEISYE